ncbi:hypothetical protein [Rhodoplanes sp. Z2-YC6860]|uniref:hypothetical protein n=1 Tax=Rhodoplanes sp. Z2-YC6860 TaxID=674703 RepID=UPI00082AD8F5|nr:hypothetical protein [Rhodoplanes sp. Z2-YC6860]
MHEGSDYRKRAEECTALAQAARTPSQRTMLLHIADTWMRLAREAEDREQGGLKIELPRQRLM